MDKSPNDICSILLDTNRWSEFEGYSILPGIEKAEFEKRTAEVVGSRIKTRNTDGSSHVEEVIEWDVNKKVVFKFQEFNSPLKNFATHFIEEWNFVTKDEGTEIEPGLSHLPGPDDRRHSRPAGPARRQVGPRLKLPLRRRQIDAGGSK